MFEAMKHPVNGVGFFTQTQSLPSCTFISYDALMWLRARITNGRHPLDILEAMRTWVENFKPLLNLIQMRFAESAWFATPLVIGISPLCQVLSFTMWYSRIRMLKVTSSDKLKLLLASYAFFFFLTDYAPPLNDYSAFVNEWLEIELQGCSFLWYDEPSPSNVPNFLRDTPAPQSWTAYCKSSEQKNVHFLSYSDFHCILFVCFQSAFVANRIWRLMWIRRAIEWNGVM